MNNNSTSNIYYKSHEGLLFKGDCIEILNSTIPKNTIDLIIIDPPYNGVVRDKWDNQWKTTSDYINWLGASIIKLERTLKNTGSFYIFHNNFRCLSLLDNWIQNNTNLIFKQLITWNKRFENSPYKGFLDGYVTVENLKNYQQMTEYILFYTLQDDLYNFKNKYNFQSLRIYFKNIQQYINLSLKDINKTLGHRKAEHCFYWNSSQWSLCTEDVYSQLITIFKINQYPDFKKYNQLKKEYEKLKYTFNNQKSHHSVWNYDIEKKIGHITPKPIPLLENLIKHSSNENDIILDCFAGSGSTGIAAHNLNRKYLLIEKEEQYCDIIKNRFLQLSN